MAITDAGGRIVYVNPAFEKTNGSAGPDSWASVIMISWPRRARTRASGSRLKRPSKGAKSGARISSESTKTPKPASSISISPIRDRSGQVINYLVVERDVTQEVRLQQHLRQTQKMEALGTLAGGIAHDFNNILNPIFINTELVLLDAPLDADARRELELVLQAAERGRDLVKQIITFSRQKEKERRPLKVGPVVKEALKFLRASLPSDDRDPGEDSSPRRGSSWRTPRQIHQVVMNLCNNAAYAMRERGGVLEVGLAEVEVDEEYGPAPSRPQARALPQVDGHGHGHRDDARGDGAGLRSLLHHQEAGRGVGHGAGRGPRDRQGLVRAR